MAASSGDSTTLSRSAETRSVASPAAARARTRLVASRSSERRRMAFEPPISTTSASSMTTAFVVSSRARMPRGCRALIEGRSRRRARSRSPGPMAARAACAGGARCRRRSCSRSRSRPRARRRPTISRRRSVSPGRPASAPRIRYSVWLSATLAPPHATVRRVGSSWRIPDSPSDVGICSPQQRVQAGDELTEGERFGDIVVAAGAEAGDAIGCGIERGQEEHGRADALCAEGLAEVAAVGVLEPDVDDEDVGRAFAVLSQCRFRALAAHDLETFLAESLDEEAAKVVIVLHDMDERGHWLQYRLLLHLDRHCRRVRDHAASRAAGVRESAASRCLQRRQRPARWRRARRGSATGPRHAKGADRRRRSAA